MMSLQSDHSEKKICTRCIYDDSVPSISFDDKGVCNFCHMVDQLSEEYQTGQPIGESAILTIVEQIKKEGKDKQYDCVIGVSGGTDSSYMVYWALQHGLRPLAVHYDNTWNTSIATENIRKVLGKLKVDLYTHVTDNKEADDIFKAFFLAGVPEIEASTDLALAETMYRAAAKYKIKYILEGHSFIAEGISPLGKNYFDGKYISSIHKLFGKIPMKTYPLMTFWKFIKWTTFYRIKKIRPLWYIKYSKEEAKAFLEKEFGWEYYGGHHLENRMTSFFHSVYCPQKFHVDYRNNSLSASVRSGQMSREDALDEYYNKAPYIEPELLNYFKKRLKLSDAEYDEIMAKPPKYWQQFPTYKKTFENLRPFFYMLMKSNLIPQSFYMKYCFPIKSK
ncbi:N-acetyl sugar amidotransferase [Daejeonella sp.]|uniref:N-acetyl sugar amidotransferase n=1 Tax=Daejeonella sp. TaxID=2805397 RepID=UPI0026CE9C68|nr:N-acetyl sugar amidotransferase [Daejeonella sp.]HQT24178.1 N-acetyl sugar amidotransferase [Daejeonella sp.]HQT58788.1 N-acetyl sugar amidotransferase [Daejeonella sp.]